jgi:hypothetical protein
MRPPFEKWDMTAAERVLGDAMERHRARAEAEARALDDALLAKPNLVPPVNRHAKPWHLRFRDAFPSWSDFVAAIRGDADPGAVEIALQLLARVAPEEVLPVARTILSSPPWREMGMAVGEALGRVDDPAAVELALAYAEVPYVKGGVSSSVCARAWPIVLGRLRASRVMDTSRTHPRGETHFVESLIRYFGVHHVEEAWPVLAKLYGESEDEYVLLAAGHALFDWRDVRSLTLLRKDIGSKRDQRRLFAVRAHLAEGASRAMDALGGLEGLRAQSGRLVAGELMEQVWRAAREAKEPIGDERYLELALAWAKDERMLGGCRYVLDSFGKAKVAAAKKRLEQGGRLAKRAPAKPKAADVARVRASMKKARANLERIVRELHEIGYVFSAKKPLGRPASARTLSALEKAVGGPLPVSLRMAFEWVGSCDLTGTFPGQAASLRSDAFVLVDAKSILEEALENADGEVPWQLAFAPDAVGKAGFSGGQETIVVPDGSLDARVEGVDGKPFFLDRMREVFRAGGFPGLAKQRGELATVVRRLAGVCVAI